MRKVIIIGSGCAGLTAAIYAARAELQPLVLDGYEPGGQLGLTTLVENFPGFPDGILGPALIENARKQAQRFGAEFASGAVTSVDLSKRPFKIVAGKETYRVRGVDYRLRRIGADAGDRVGKTSAGTRRFDLRHLRRLFLPRARHYRGGRRRHGDGRGHLSDEICEESDAGAPAE